MASAKLGVQNQVTDTVSQHFVGQQKLRKSSDKHNPAISCLCIWSQTFVLCIIVGIVEMYLPPLNLSQKAFAWRTLIHHTSREFECQILYASLASWSLTVFEMLPKRSFQLVLHDCMCLRLAAYFIICKDPWNTKKDLHWIHHISLLCLSLCRLFWSSENEHGRIEFSLHCGIFSSSFES